MCRIGRHYFLTCRLFEDYDVKKALKNTAEDWTRFTNEWDAFKEPVGGLKGVYVKCGATHTVFEFETYRYHRGGPGKKRTDSKPDGEEASPGRQSASTHGTVTPSNTGIHHSASVPEVVDMENFDSF